jgi:hypothetical protein
VFVLFDPQEKEVSTASNMSDDATLGLLEEAVEVLKQPEVEEDLTIN